MADFTGRNHCQCGTAAAPTSPCAWDYDDLVLSRILLFTTLLPLGLSAQVKVTSTANGIEVEIDGKPYTTLYYGKLAPKPYLHPLRNASGQIITRRWPMEDIAGESHDHQHHRGLWFGHGDVNGFNFWENELTYTERGNRGKIELVKMGKLKSGAKEGSFEITFRWLDPQDNHLLTEHRVMTFHGGPTSRVIDADLEVTAARTITFGDTKEGTFAMRLNDEMTELKTGKMTNAEGATTMKNIWGKHSTWVDYVGQVGGETVGVAIFDHPSNPKHPTTWHARDYGLFAANIFGEHDFYDDKTRNGSVTLQAGEKMHFRYRVVIHPGDTKAAGIAQLYATFAKGTGSAK